MPRAIVMRPMRPSCLSFIPPSNTVPQTRVHDHLCSPEKHLSEVKDAIFLQSNCETSLYEVDLEIRQDLSLADAGLRKRIIEERLQDTHCRKVSKVDANILLCVRDDHAECCSCPNLASSSGLYICTIREGLKQNFYRL